MRQAFDFNHEQQPTRPLLQAAVTAAHSPLLPGEGEAHYASTSVQKKQLSSPVIEQSALLGRLDSTRPGTFRDNGVAPFIIKEPTAPPKLPDKSTTPKSSNQFRAAVYAQNEQSELVGTTSRSGLRKDHNLSRQAPPGGTLSGISQLQTVPTSRIADSDMSKTERRNAANVSGLTPAMPKKQFSISQLNQYTSDFTDPPGSRRSAMLQPGGDSKTGVREHPIVYEYGNTTSKKMIYHNSYGMFGVNLGGRPTSTASLERSKLSQYARVPPADVSGTDGYNSPRGFEHQHSKDRILNTTFQ